MIEYQKDLSIQIVSHNELDKTIRTIKHLKNDLFNCLDYEIIVVDNASNDNTFEIIKNNYPEIKVIRNDVGQYFSKGHNQASRLSAGKYILILCPDIKSENGVILELFNYMEKNSNVGGCSPGIYSEDGSFITTTWDRHKFLNLISQKMPQLFLLNKMGFIAKSSGKNIDLGDIYIAEVVRSGIFLVRCDLFKKLKGYDESMLMYASDDDLCHRIKSEGYDLVVIPYLKAFHDNNVENKTNLEVLRIAWHDYFYYSLKYMGKFKAYVIYFFGALEYYLTLIKRQLKN